MPFETLSSFPFSFLFFFFFLFSLFFFSLCDAFSAGGGFFFGLLSYGVLSTGTSCLVCRQVGRGPLQLQGSHPIGGTPWSMSRLGKRKQLYCCPSAACLQREQTERMADYGALECTSATVYMCRYALDLIPYRSGQMINGQFDSTRHCIRIPFFLFINISCIFHLWNQQWKVGKRGDAKAIAALPT